MTESNDKTFSILIVDDEFQNIQLLGNLLREEKYDVEFATDGKAALKWISNRPFDLVLLDVMMPGIDGFEVCKKIKSDISTSHIPVIFITAKTETEDIVKGFEVGGSDYLTKPFKSPELLARVNVYKEMKILRGLIPICINCKDVRNDEGIWKRIESYIEQHSNSLFSHTMCQKCMDKIYGDKAWYKKKKKKDYDADHASG